MNRNEQFSYNDDAVLITDDFVADEDYSTVQKAVCGALGVIGAAMVVTFFKERQSTPHREKRPKKLARLYR